MVLTARDAVLSTPRLALANDKIRLWEGSLGSFEKRGNRCFTRDRSWRKTVTLDPIRKACPHAAILSLQTHQQNEGRLEGLPTLFPR
jgi:hypothetical protein